MTSLKGFKASPRKAETEKVRSLLDEEEKIFHKMVGVGKAYLNGAYDQRVLTDLSLPQVGDEYRL